MAERQRFMLVSGACVLTNKLVSAEPTLTNFDEYFGDVAYLTANIGPYLSIFSDDDLAEKAVVALRKMQPKRHWYFLKIDNLAVLKRIVREARAKGVQHVGIDVTYGAQVAGFFERIELLDKPDA